MTHENSGFQEQLILCVVPYKYTEIICCCIGLKFTLRLISSSSVNSLTQVASEPDICRAVMLGDERPGSQY